MRSHRVPGVDLPLSPRMPHRSHSTHPLLPFPVPRWGNLSSKRLNWSSSGPSPGEAELRWHVGRLPCQGVFVTIRFPADAEHGRQICCCSEGWLVLQQTYTCTGDRQLLKATEAILNTHVLCSLHVLPVDRVRSQSPAHSPAWPVPGICGLGVRDPGTQVKTTKQG